MDTIFQKHMDVSHRLELMQHAFNLVVNDSESSTQDVLEWREKVHEAERELIESRSHPQKFSTPETQLVYEEFIDDEDLAMLPEDIRVCRIYQQLENDFENVCQSRTLTGCDMLQKVRTAELIKSLFWKSIHRINFEEVAKALSPIETCANVKL